MVVLSTLALLECCAKFSSVIYRPHVMPQTESLAQPNPCCNCRSGIGRSTWKPTMSSKHSPPLLPPSLSFPPALPAPVSSCNPPGFHSISRCPGRCLVTPLHSCGHQALMCFQLSFHFHNCLISHHQLGFRACILYSLAHRLAYCTDTLPSTDSALLFTSIAKHRINQVN